ncbi:hypothetical protein [Aquisalimonas asiatica]|uniref:Uncharacterized protein n=1 Tax=Aquisalimonas asiatica TaxID=406100 RepID=A0A1H8UCA7_9GAMM|nr:hypothetical protein [Aquisalimonas asiatica]SEP00892.1 hypothetical protein SAMN04488052_10694 [Aquisalimonas asiatica]
MKAPVIDIFTRDRITPNGRRRRRLPKNFKKKLEPPTLADHGWYKDDLGYYRLQATGISFTVFPDPHVNGAWRVSEIRPEWDYPKIYFNQFDAAVIAMQTVIGYLHENGIELNTKR